MLSTYPTRDGAASLKGAVWIDLLDPTDDETKAVAAELDVAVPTRAQLEEIESSSRLQADDNRLHLSVPLFARGDDADPSPLGFILTPAYLVTVRFSAMRTFEQTVKVLDRQKQICTSAEIFAILIEAMVDFTADTLEQTGTELNAVSRDVFRRYRSTRQHNIARSNRRMRDTLVAVGGAGERLSQIRDSILGMQRVMPFVAEKGMAWIDASIQARLKTAGLDLQSLSDFEVHLSNKVQFLLDAVLGFINTEQNDIFKVLTLVSVIGIPPTLIASMYGMNFHYMPEYSWTWGYEWGLGLIVLSAVLPMIWFKWRGWW